MNCDLCRSDARRVPEGSAGYRVECAACGPYFLTVDASSYLAQCEQPERSMSALAYRVRWLALHRIDLKRVHEVEAEGAPSPLDQISRLILWLGESSIAGQELRPTYSSLVSVCGATEEGIAFLVGSVKDRGWLTVGSCSNQNVRLQLGMEGWREYESLRREQPESRRVLFACAFGNRELRTLLDDYLVPAVRQAGFELYRLDQDPKAGLIDDRLRVALRTGRFLIADLSDRNLGAYWEAGFVEGLGRPVIYTCEESVFEKPGTHFDTNHMHTVTWSSERPGEAAEDVKAAIRATLPGEAIMED